MNGRITEGPATPAGQGHPRLGGPSVLRSGLSRDVPGRDARTQTRRRDAAQRRGGDPTLSNTEQGEERGGPRILRGRPAETTRA